MQVMKMHHMRLEAIDFTDGCQVRKNIEWQQQQTQQAMPAIIKIQNFYIVPRYLSAVVLRYLPRCPHHPALCIWYG